jgi:hypothetical protein
MKTIQYCATLCVHCLLATAVNAGLIVNLNPTGGVSANAIAGFQQAADYWESALADNVTFNLNIDFGTFTNPSTLGSASSTTQSQEVSGYFAALQSDATSADDLAAIGALPTLGGLNNNYIQFRTQVDTEGGSTVVSLDSDGSIATGGTNNRILSLNTSVAKALGLFTGLATDADASIKFNSAFSWDFDQTDGRRGHWTTGLCRCGDPRDWTCVGFSKWRRYRGQFHH